MYILLEYASHLALYPARFLEDGCAPIVPANRRRYFHSWDLGWLPDSVAATPPFPISTSDSQQQRLVRLIHNYMQRSTTNLAVWNWLEYERGTFTSAKGNVGLTNHIRSPFHGR